MISATPFDPETEGAVDVIVRRGDEVQYYAVGSNGHVQDTPAIPGGAPPLDDITMLCLEYKARVAPAGGA